MNLPGRKSHNAQKAADRTAFEALVADYYASLLAVARQITHSEDAARDVVQDVFSGVWLRWRSLGGMDALAGYLYNAVRNRALNHLRSEKRRQGLYDNLLAEQPWRYHVIEEETNRLLLAAIDKLPPRSREVLRHILSGMDLVQIAETMDISVNTVKWMRADALKRLKIKLNI